MVKLEKKTYKKNLLVYLTLWPCWDMGKQVMSTECKLATGNVIFLVSATANTSAWIGTAMAVVRNQVATLKHA